MIVFPIPLFVVSFLVLSLAAWLGVTRFEKRRVEAAALREEFTVIQGATLTLLGLIVGFTFSMALDRYEQRKNFEGAEANAINAAFQRAELLPPADTARLRSLLLNYLDQRVLFYSSRSLQQLEQIVRSTPRQQAELWSAVRVPATANPTALTALAVEGINNVINAEGDTQAAWLNRIPGTAWLLMGAIAICATLLVGIGVNREVGFARVLGVLPLIISIAFYLIADIESPRLGIISVVPENLMSLAGVLHGQ
jgi:hypothetical protein